MGSNEEINIVPVSPVVHKFGDDELSDVTFIVGGERFMCHKMLLAARSPYFKAMFCSNFKEKDQLEVPIVAEPVAFLYLMEIIYTGHLNCWKELLTCNTMRKMHTACFASSVYGPLWMRMPPAYEYAKLARSKLTLLWTRCHDLMHLADQYGVLKSTVTVLQNYFLRSIDGEEHEENCKCGIKLIIALMYGMEDYMNKSTTTRNSVANAMAVIKTIQPSLTLDPLHIQWLLRRY